ncbi:MAG: type transport system permease protein [Solirubrobacteraceae bacterium]|jgi:ABC-2 type transport system permease protein|nr:type transport system permease protein [Solirubrobacteraceae bacterium]
MTALARTRSVAGAVAWRSIHNAFTNPAFLLPSVLFPLFFFVAFAGGLSGVQNAPNFNFKSGYTSFQFSFVCIQAAAFGGVFTGFAIAADFEFGFARRLLLAAPHRGGIVIGYMMSAMTRATFVLGVVFLAGLISGMHVDGSIGDLLALLLLALAVSATSTLWAAGIAMRLRTMQAGPVMQMPIFILLFLAPVYVPLNLVAGWVHDVARYNPFTAMLESSRGFISGEPTKVAITSACLAGLFALTVLWARGGLRSAERAG